MMALDMSPTTRAVFHVIALDGYRCGIGMDGEIWICTAKRDHDNQLHVSKAPTEDQVVAELAGLVGIGLCDG